MLRPILPLVTTLPASAWFAIAGIGSATVIAFLYFLAILVRNDDAAQALQAEVARVRRDFASGLDGDKGAEIIVVDEAPPPESSATRAAA